MISDIVFFIIHAAILLVTVLMGGPDHALAVELLLAHLVKAVLFVVAVCYDTSDFLSRSYVLLLLSIWTHCIIIFVGLLSAASVLIVELKVTAFVDFFSSGDGVFEVDADFVFTVVIDIVRILLILVHFVVILDVHPLVTLFLTLVFLVFVQLDIDLIVMHDALRVLVLLFVSIVALLVRR